MKYLLLTLMLICSGCMIPYSVTIPPCHGTVIDEESNKPIESARVIINGYPETACETDKNGKFTTTPTSFRRVVSFGDRLDYYDLITDVNNFESVTNSVMVFRQDEIDIGTIKMKAEQ